MSARNNDIPLACLETASDNVIGDFNFADMQEEGFLVDGGCDCDGGCDDGNVDNY